MRRIYESSALSRDDSDPFSPSTDSDGDRPQAVSWIDSEAWSRRLMPTGLRYRALAVEITTPREEYAIGESVPFAVTMKNTLPVPITVTTRSPLVWTWDVDGIEEASRIPLQEPPDERGQFRFDRGERKQFERHWQQMFRLTETEWEQAQPGEYTIGAGLNVERATEHDVYDQTTVRVVRAD